MKSVGYRGGGYSASRRGLNRQKSDSRILFGGNGQKKEQNTRLQVETIEEYLFTRRDIAEHLTGSKARGRYGESTGW